MAPQSVHFNQPRPAALAGPHSPRNRALRRLAASAAPSRLSSTQARVLELRQGGADLYSTGAAAQELAAAVADLIASNACAKPGPDSLLDGQGTWEVFHAPHIARLSAALRARFQPIRYTLRGGELISNVRYQHPLLGAGWLSASGTLAAADDATLLLSFDRFWVDFGEDALRPELPPSPSSQDPSSSAAIESSAPSGSGSGSSNGGSSGGGSGLQAAIDGVVGALGRAAFLPSLARFPVQYLDGGEAGLAVFRFPPLASSIAVARVGAGGSNGSGSSNDAAAAAEEGTRRSLA